MMYHSVAVSGHGVSDPEGVDVFDYEGDDCPLDHCVHSNCDHHIIMWRGKEYSRRNTWISADSDTLISLKDYE